MDYRRLRHSIPVISPKAAFHSRTASAQNIAPSSEGDAGLGPLISQISALKIGIQKLTDHVSIVDQRVARVESMLMAQDKTGGHHGTVKQFVKEFEAVRNIPALSQSYHHCMLSFVSLINRILANRKIGDSEIHGWRDLIS